MKWLGRGLLWLLLLTAAWGALVYSGVLARPTTEQRAALEAMRTPPPKLGERNAYPALWLSSWDVPQGEQARVMDDDVVAWGAFHARHAKGEHFESTAKGRYPEVARPTSQEKALCQTWEPSCLARVRADPAAVRAALAKYEAFARHSRALGQYDHFHMLLPWTLDAPLPSMVGYPQLELSAAALKAVDGDLGSALADTCRFGATWRRLRAHADALIADMIGVAYLSSASHLAADILVEMPADTAWPAECEAAFAPLSDGEFDQCAEIHSEFGGIEDAVTHPEKFNEKPGPGGVLWIERQFTNTHRLAAAVAPAYSRFCGMAAPRERMAPLAAGVTHCGAMQWAFDPFGCAMQGDSMPELSQYHNRLLDLDARLKALQTVRWLRAQPPGTDPALRPAALQTPEQPMTLSADGTQLTITLFDEKAERHEWRLPVVAPVVAR